MAKTSELHHTHITSKNKLLSFNLKEVWKYRDLVTLFIRRDFVLTYKQTILGPLWIILNPFISTVIYTVVFGGIAGIATDGIPKILFYMLSNTVWTFFASCITKTSSTFTANAAVFGKVYFPRLVTPISTVSSAAINLFIQLAMFACFWIFYLVKGEVKPNWALLILFPFVILLLAAMGLGCGIIVSSLTTKYRDLAIAVTFGVQLWMYATPVVYPLSTLGEGTMRTILSINPVTSYVEIIRYIFLGQGTFTLGGCIWSIVFTLFVLIAGIILFNKVEKTFMDTV